MMTSSPLFARTLMDLALYTFKTNTKLRYFYNEYDWSLNKVNYSKETKDIYAASHLKTI